MNSSKESRKNKLYPLTHPQKRIWYIEKIHPNTPVYNIGGTVRIKGKINHELLEQAIQLFISRHKSLHLRFCENSERVRQYICQESDIKLDFIDFTSDKKPKEKFNKWVEDEAKRPFRLVDSRLFYFALYQVSENHCGYLVRFHHIIADGWSIQIMTEQIKDIYLKLMADENVKTDLSSTYEDYIWKEQEYLSSGRLIKHKQFWLEKFEDLQDVFLNKSSDIITGNRKSFEVDEAVSCMIKDFTMNNGMTLNTLFIALYLIYYNKITGQKDIVIGIPVFNRHGKKEKKIFGMFTSTMPFRFLINSNKSFMEIIDEVSNELMKCYYNQKYPYNLLVQDLELRKRGYDNLFNTCINYYNTRHNTDMDGCEVENIEFYNGHQIYGMQIIIRDWSSSGCLTLDFDYKTEDYTEQEIENLYNHILYLLKQLINNPLQHISVIPMLSEIESNDLAYTFNATARNYPNTKTISQLFEEQAVKTPDKIVIQHDDKNISYKELNERSNQLARYLVKNDVTKESVVGLIATHSIEVIIGILSIIKAGAVFLPIDPVYPNERINYMLEDSNCGILLTNIHKEISFDGKIIQLNNTHNNEEVSNLSIISFPDDLIYILYTSGSTGKPKGTMIKHRGVVNYIWWAKKVYIDHEDEVFPLYSSLAFDLTMTSIFTPIISGSKLIIYNDNDEDEYVLFRILRDHQATIIKLTPAHLSLLKDRSIESSSVKKLIVGGENLTVKLASDIYKVFNKDIEIYNEYGPTETVVGCMIHRYEYEKDTSVSVPIGKPIDNTQIYILNEHHQLIPKGALGELYVSGDGVARGYLNNPKLTQEKFIPNPFRNGELMYKTGDQARFIDDSLIEYAGRIDKQVKIRGYRIELGDIENQIISHKDIIDTVVVDIVEDNGVNNLCAYVVYKNKINVNKLKAYLLDKLPDYMIPLYIIEIETIPLTNNGKVDKTLLPKPNRSSGDEIDFISYRNQEEKVLVEAISIVLHIKNPSIKENFYHIGGDSIKAIQVASRLHELGYKIKVKDILAYPIIEEMVLCVKKNGVQCNQQPARGKVKPTPIICWFLNQEFTNIHHYNQSIIIKLKSDIDVRDMEKILEKIIRHHDSLRLNYNQQTDELYYNHEHLDYHAKIQEYLLSDLTDSVQLEKMTSIAERLKGCMDIGHDILLKACIFNLGQQRIMILTAHHLVVDGVSWRIILDDMDTLMEQLQNKQKLTLPAKTVSYQVWSEQLLKHSEEVMNEADYWNNILCQQFEFPLIDYEGDDKEHSTNTILSKLSIDMTKLLLEAQEVYNTNTEELLITALARTVNQLTGSKDIVIELESHGREELSYGLDVTRTVGWFTALYPLHVSLPHNDLSSQIKSVKESIRTIPHRGIGFGILKYLTKCLKDTDKKRIRFNYMGHFSNISENRNFELISERLGEDIGLENHLSCLLEINCYILNNQLHTLFGCEKYRIQENKMKKFIANYESNLEGIIVHCCEKDSKVFTPSDFDTVELAQDELDNLFD